uniref:Uncharacterized protein n=1 Tax=Aegilops tauschii TaxID=37682 RepID=M8B817_AEGTA
MTSLNLVSRTIFSIDLTSLDDHGRSKEFQEGMRWRLARLFARLHAVSDAEGSIPIPARSAALSGALLRSAQHRL